MHAQAGVKFWTLQALMAGAVSGSAGATLYYIKMAWSTRRKFSQTQTFVPGRLGCRRSQPASPCSSPKRRPMPLADQ